MLPWRRALAGIGFSLVVLSANDVALCADDIVTLGAALSLTGKYAIAGADTKNGYDLAIREINNGGGVAIGGKPFRLQIRYYDDESTPVRGSVLAEQLIEQDGVNFMLGPYGSGLTLAMTPVTERHKIPMVAANGAASEIFTKGYRYVFGVLSTADQYLTQALELARANAGKLGKSENELTLAIATEDDAFGQDVRAGVLEHAMRLGIDCVIDDRLPPELDEMTVTLKKVKMLKPDVLVISGREKGALTAVKQIEALEVDVPIVALTHCDSARLAEKMPEAAANMFCAKQWHRSVKYRGELFGAAEDFARRFEEAYGYEAPYQAAQSAAAVHVFAEALERAQSLEPEKVRDAIAATDVITFYGPIKFDESGKNVAKLMVMTQIIDGKHVIVMPKELATQDPVIEGRRAP